MALAGAQTHLLLTPKSDESESDVPHLVLKVDDVVAMHRELEAKGVTFKAPPTDAPWNPGEKFSVLKDSESNAIFVW